MRRYKSLLGVLLLFIGLSSAQAKIIDKIVAVVNGEIVTLYELNMRLDIRRVSGNNLEISQKGAKRRKQVLYSMVNDILLLQEADRLQITVSDLEVQNKIEQMLQSRRISKESFRSILRDKDLTLKEYKDRVRRELKKNKLLTTMVRQKIIVTKKEIREYYREHSDKYQTPQKCSICMIYLRDRNKLEDLRQKISNGKISFTNAANKYSLGPASEQGGCLGSINWNEMKEKWKNFLKNMHSGEISSTVPLQNGYGLFLLQSKKTRTTKPSQEVRRKIRKKIYSRKLQERYQEYIDSLRSNALLKIRL